MPARGSMAGHSPGDYLFLAPGSGNLDAARQSFESGDNGLDPGGAHLLFSANERIVILEVSLAVRGTRLEPYLSAHCPEQKRHERQEFR